MPKIPGPEGNHSRTIFRESQMALVYNDIQQESLPVDPSLRETLSGWICINFCEEGRCESSSSFASSVVIVPQTCSLALGDYLPDVYRYPLGYYRGPELFFSLDLLDAPEFSLLREGGFSREKWESFFKEELYLSRRDPVLSDLIRSLMDIPPGNPALYKLRLIEILLYIDRTAIPGDEPVSFYSRKQLRIAEEVHDALLRAPEQPCHLKDLAAKYGVSVSTLNRYYSAVYGEPVPAWLFRVRMELAEDLLRNTNFPILQIAASTGYSNASKFSAAFKRATGQSPTEYRKQAASRT